MSKAALERRTGVLFGTYRGHHPVITRLPLWIGPIGGAPRVRLTVQTWLQGWRGACGAEVAVFGRTAYAYHQASVRR